MPEQSAMQSLERLRSRAAWEAADRWGSRVGKDAKATAQGLPVLIRSQGCAASLALLRRQGSPLAEDLLRWLIGGGDQSWPSSPITLRSPTLEGFLGDFVRLSVAEARLVDGEALRYAVVLKLYASVLY